MLITILNRDINQEIEMIRLIETMASIVITKLALLESIEASIETRVLPESLVDQILQQFEPQPIKPSITFRQKGLVFSIPMKR